MKTKKTANATLVVSMFINKNPKCHFLCIFKYKIIFWKKKNFYMPENYYYFSLCYLIYFIFIFINFFSFFCCYCSKCWRLIWGILRTNLWWKLLWKMVEKIVKYNCHAIGIWNEMLMKIKGKIIKIDSILLLLEDKRCDW